MKPIQTGFRILASILTAAAIMGAAYLAMPYLAVSMSAADAGTLAYVLGFFLSFHLGTRAVKRGQPVSTFVQTVLPALTVFFFTVPAGYAPLLWLASTGFGIWMTTLSFVRRRQLNNAAPA